jgi:PPIC-type PPIASE domain
MPTKKTTKDVERDQDKEKEIEDEPSGDDGEDEEEQASEEEEEKARPVRKAEARGASNRERARAHAREAEHDDDHADDEDDDDDEAETDGEDPYWWSPYAVMGALILIGLVGFLGGIKRPGWLPAMPAGEAEKPVAAATKETAPTPTPPKPPAQPGADQPPREMFGAKHLLVMYKGSRRAPPNVERSKEEAKARATEAMKKAKDSKNKFEDLVKEYSDEPNAGARGGDLGKFPKGAMVPEFQTALEKIKVNEISEVVETPFGFHVILRTQ